MRRIIGSIIDRACRSRARRHLSRYGAFGPGVSLDQLTFSLESVRGMMSPEAGPMLFMLSVTQRLNGDIIEIGSWQGRSTIFLAKGAKVSGNGKVFAIDHFLGNPGKEGLYQVSHDDLSDLPANFTRNIEVFEVTDVVELLAVQSTSAAETLTCRGVRARFLFIDGNHQYEAVRADFAAFCHLLLPGALVAFDDFSASFPGVTRCVGDLADAGVLVPLFSYGNCFVGEFAGV